MMYLVWFVEFLFNLLFQPIRIFGAVINCIITALDSVITLIFLFPAWLSYPFMALVSIAVIFRISQFIPTIGGASNN